MERCIAAFSARSERIGETYSFDDVYERLSGNGTPILVIFSSDFDHFADYSGLFHEKFPESDVLGMSSECNYSSEGFSDTGLSALAIYSGIECSCGVLHEAGKCPIKYMSAVKEAIEKLGITSSEADRICSLEFTASVEYNEELVLDTFRTARGNLKIPLLGSTAAERRGTGRSYVSLNGKVYEDECVFAFIRNMNGRISMISENTYRSTGKTFMATDVDCDSKTVYSFNERPAAVHLASLIGVDVPVVARDIARFPIGRIYDDIIYTATGRNVGKDASIVFGSAVYNYSKAVLLEPDDPHRTAGRFIEKLDNLGFSPAFSLAVNCAFDFDIFADTGITGKFIGQLAEKAGVYTGVSGRNEQLGCANMSKTMLLAAFE